MKNQIYFSWQDFQNDLFLINSKIQLSGWVPEYIVGVKRGGLIPAVCFSHLFNVPMYTTTLQTRDGSKNLDISELSNLDYNYKILIIDDICDTGDTFTEIKNKITNFKNIRFCSLFYNIRQSFVVDYYARKIDRNKNLDWVVFPWEKL
jgi:hypoxanthine phosphoribosyltransferase